MYLFVVFFLNLIVNISKYESNVESNIEAISFNSLKALEALLLKPSQAYMRAGAGFA